MTNGERTTESLSTFGLRISFVIRHSSFVIQRFVRVRFMVPMHGIKVLAALHESLDDLLVHLLGRVSLPGRRTARTRTRRHGNRGAHPPGTREGPSQPKA